MAQSINFVGGFTPQVTPASDFSGNQFRWVSVHGGAVPLADVRSIVVGPAYVLQNKPGSGVACDLWGSPNISKAIAGEAITAGTYVQPMSASGLSGVSSAAIATGFALTGATGSGAYFDCRLVR